MVYFPTKKHKKKIATYLMKIYYIKLVYQVNNSLVCIIKTNNNKIPNINKAEVYKLTCGTCLQVYFGQTERAFKTRIEKHKKFFSNNKQNSTNTKHIINTGHTFNKDF